MKEKIDTIIRETCLEYGITEEQLKGKKRLAEYVVARRAVVYNIFEEIPWLTNRYVGEIINRDRARVCNLHKEAIIERSNRANK